MIVKYNAIRAMVSIAILEVKVEGVHIVDPA
jgi:hypothetical protein